MEQARRRWWRSIASLVIVVTAACSDGGSSDPPPVESGPSDAADSAAATDGDPFTPVDPGESGAGADADLGPVAGPAPDAEVSDSVAEPIEPVPETGVPGIDSDDAFCRSWSEFAGSYQALSFAWAVQGAVDAARLEVIASDVLPSAIETMTASLPAALEPEREALVVELPGPILRRAERAREILLVNGQDDASVEQLGELWLAAVADQGLDAETLTVSIDDSELDAAVEESALMLLDELPPIIEDPSLIVDVEIPLTEAYLFDNCPDRGTLAGNDRVDS